jgi:hypothetical protein
VLSHQGCPSNPGFLRPNFGYTTRVVDLRLPSYIGTIRHPAFGRRRMLAAVLGCIVAALLFAQVAGVFHQLSHLQGDRHDAPGHLPVKAACDICGAFAALGAPLGTPPALPPVAQPPTEEFPGPILPEPRAHVVSLHNRDPPVPAPLALTA